MKIIQMKLQLERVSDMVAWARSRIAHCVAEERRLEAERRAQDAPGIAILAMKAPAALIEARVERRTLQAVLNQLVVEDHSGGAA